MKLHGSNGPGDVEGRLRNAVNRISGPGKIWRVLATIILLGLAINLLARSVVSVGAGERAVIFSRFSGVLPTQLGEGWHLLVPWVWQAQRYDVKRQSWTISIGEQLPQVGRAEPEPQLIALTKDGQQVILDVSVVYHPDPTRVWRLHQRVGSHYRNKVIRPHTHAACRMVVSQFPVTEVYSGSREAIQQRIAQELGESLKEWDIILDQLLLRNVKFSDEFQQAIEAKQVAIQEYERMQYILQTAQKTSQKTIIEAEGQAEALRVQGNALRANPLMLQYEYTRKTAPSVRAVITSRATVPPARPEGR
jgi:regulator of protease activity HflC (stomatin/prohibitin superfamily)